MITLRVAEAKSRDTLRGKVRINNQAMKELGISTGEIVKINGPVNYTAAVVWPAYPEDLKRNIIRMDEQIRKNAGVGVAENVVLEIVPIEKAKKVVLQKVKVNFSTDFGFDNFVKRKLKGYPMTKGDFITIPVLMDDNPFKVREILPQDEIVILGEFTEIIVVDSSYLDSIEKEELENRKTELLTLFYEIADKPYGGSIGEVSNNYLSKNLDLTEAKTINIVSELLKEGRLPNLDQYRDKRYSSLTDIIWVVKPQKEDVVSIEDLKSAPFVPNRNNKLSVQPLYTHRKIQSDEDLILVLLPFSKRSRNHFEKIIKPSIQDLNQTIQCILDNELFLPHAVNTHKMWELIYSSRLILIDVTGIDPVVMYGLGVADTLGKQTILMWDLSDSISPPIDVNDRELLFYERSKSGYTKMKIELKELVSRFLLI